MDERRTREKRNSLSWAANLNFHALFHSVKMKLCIRKSFMPLFSVKIQCASGCLSSLRNSTRFAIIPQIFCCAFHPLNVCQHNAHYDLAGCAKLCEHMSLRRSRRQPPRQSIGRHRPAVLAFCARMQLSRRWCASGGGQKPSNKHLDESEFRIVSVKHAKHAAECRSSRRCATAAEAYFALTLIMKSLMAMFNPFSLTLAFVNVKPVRNMHVLEELCSRAMRQAIGLGTKSAAVHHK